MRLAAIDIGSNAIRLQIIRVIKESHLVSFKKLEYLRFPLRLGKDVFTKGYLQKETIEKFEKLMRTFKLLVELYEVDGYIATATSAMREAENGRQVVQQVATSYDLKIDIISGEDEAEILNKAIVPYLDELNYVHIDVGGGSTEINLYQNKEQISSHSFRMGSVRRLSPVNRKKIMKDISEWNNSIKTKLKLPITAVGTGGNINKIFKLSNHQLRRSISLTELQALRAYINEYGISQRVNLLKMNPDRADVIIPAADIYINVMKIMKADQVLIPGVGLKDGLLYTLYESVTNEKLQNIEFLELF